MSPMHDHPLAEDARYRYESLLRESAHERLLAELRHARRPSAASPRGRSAVLLQALAAGRGLASPSSPPPSF